jgi:hypothetical protein
MKVDIIPLGYEMERTISYTTVLSPAKVVVKEIAATRASEFPSSVFPIKDAQQLQQVIYTIMIVSSCVCFSPIVVHPGA